MHALTCRNKPRFLSLLADDCVHEDPESGGPRIGKGAIARRWDELRLNERALHVHVVGIYPSGPETAVHWMIEEEEADGTRTVATGIDILAFEEDGTVSSIYAYWHTPCPPESIPAQLAAQRYVAAMNARNRGEVLSLWSREGVRQDPMGAPPRIGIDAIGESFDRIVGKYPDFTIKIEALCGAGSEAAMAWRSELRGPDAVRTIRGVDVLSVDQHGALSALHSSTDSDAFRV